MSTDDEYEPAIRRELFIKDRKTPKSIDDLWPIEFRQLQPMIGQDVDLKLREGDGYDFEVEIAMVVDDQGTPLYRLYAMNFGVVYLMPLDSLEVLAFANEHAIEPWYPSQRDLFWAMDRALRRGDHGIEQPMEFRWQDDEPWQELASAPPGSIENERLIRMQFAIDFST